MSSNTTPHIHVGNFVKIHGLVNTPVYNGQVALVIGKPKKGSDADVCCGVQILDHAQGWNEARPDATLETGGEVISVKVSNLTPRQRDSEHWEIPSTDLTVLERIRYSHSIGSIDRCNDFCQAVWDCYFETIPPIPFLLDEEETRQALVDTPGHTIAWLALDAIQHHLLIEKCRGRFRVYQSYIKEFAGFTGNEWCEVAGSHSPLKHMQAHKTFGGGRTVGKNEIHQLLDVVKQLQDLTTELVPILLRHVEGIDKATIQLFQQQDPTTLSPAQLERAQDAIDLVLQWCNMVETVMKGPVGLTTLGVGLADGQVDKPTEAVKIVQNDTTRFEIPVHLFEQTRDLYRQITGQVYLGPAVFLRMVNSGVWIGHMTNKVDGGAVGFAVRHATFDEEESYEEEFKRHKKRRCN